MCDLKGLSARISCIIIGVKHNAGQKHLSLLLVEQLGVFASEIYFGNDFAGRGFCGFHVLKEGLEGKRGGQSVVVKHCDLGNGFGKIGSFENIGVINVANNKHGVTRNQISRILGANEYVFVNSKRLKLSVADLEGFDAFVYDYIDLGAISGGDILVCIVDDRHGKACYTDAGADRVKIGVSMSHNKHAVCGLDLVFDYFAANARNDGSIIFDGFVSASEECVSVGVLSSDGNLVSSALYCDVERIGCRFFFFLKSSANRCDTHGNGNGEAVVTDLLRHDLSLDIEILKHLSVKLFF